MIAKIQYPISNIYHSITQGGGQAVQDGGLEQEGLDASGLTVQDFFDQVVQYVAVAAREGLDEAGGILSLLHGHRCQLQLDICAPGFCRRCDHGGR